MNKRLLKKVEDCEHLRVETLFRYDRQKNRVAMWTCRNCHLLFGPIGLLNAELKQLKEATLKLLESLGMHKIGDQYGFNDDLSLETIIAAADLAFLVDEIGG